jgi:hypothetical protein
VRPPVRKSADSCGYEMKAAHADCGRCPKCGMRLWAKAIPRKVRFHDLRHTRATLLLKEGVPLATVQRILRHSDPRLRTRSTVTLCRRTNSLFEVGRSDILLDEGPLPRFIQAAGV